jgi:hypothetical protein
MSLHLFDNYSAVWSSTTDSAVETGNRFAVSNDATLDELRWYRRDTTSGHKPEVLRCWDLTTHAVIAQATSIPDNGSIGWQTAVAPDAITLLPGHVYCVTAYWPDGTTASNRGLTSSPIVSKPAPLIASGNTRGYHGTTLGEPTSSDSVFAEATDVGITDLGPGEGSGSGTLTGDLNAWLNTSAPPNAHDDDGLPWRTDANVTLLREAAEGATGFDAIKGVADTIATSVGTGLRTAVTAITTNLATANTALVHAATTWSDALAAALQAMSDNFASFGASKPAQGGGDFGTGTFPSNVGTLVWTMLDETDFVGSIAWAQPADVYVLSITTRPIGLPLNLTDGVHTIYRCGWWTPLNGSFGRQRSYIDFEDSHLAIAAERMPGVLVSLQPGGEGHIQAWALT